MALHSSRSPVSPRAVWSVGLQLLLLAALVALVLKAWLVVSWSLLALLLALALSSPVRAMQRFMPRGVAVLVIAVALLAVGLLAVFWLLPPLVAQARSLVERTPELVAQLRARTPFGQVGQALQPGDVLSELERAGPRMAHPILTVLRDFAQALAATVTIATLTGFALLSGPSVAEALFGWFPPSRRPRYRRIADDIVEKIGGYVAGTLVLVVMNGAVVTLLLLALGVPYALPLGLLCALLSLIPYAGSSVFMVLQVCVVLAERGLHVALLAVGGTFAWFAIKDRILDPLVMRHTTKMNPWLSTEAILLGSAVAGLKGTVLALPVAAAIQVILRELKSEREARWDQGSRPGVPTPPPAPEAGPLPPPDEHPPLSH